MPEIAAGGIKTQASRGNSKTYSDFYSDFFQIKDFWVVSNKQNFFTEQQQNLDFFSVCLQ